MLGGAAVGDPKRKKDEGKSSQKQDEEVSPTENLMREHGVHARGSSFHPIADVEMADT